MKYTKAELRSISADYPFLFESLFLEKNHHILRSVVKNLEGNISGINAIRMKNGEIALRCGDRVCAQRRFAPQRISDEERNELLQIDALRRFAAFESSDSDVRSRMQRQLQAALS